MEEGQPSVKIHELWLENKDDKKHHIEILLLREDEPIFVRSLPVEEATYEGNDLKKPGGRAWQDVASEKAPYTLHARIDENDWFTTRFEEFGEGCVRVGVEINRSGNGLFVYSACYEDTTTE